ncbi:MAG: hypothetical protein J7K61_01690, partial [Thermoplasmata archaeon]|nr:hypothetical protein [Thermoplasmata archaeon]
MNWLSILIAILMLLQPAAFYHGWNESEAGQFEVQWEKSYGKLVWWSARYEGPQPVGDADNDGKNE